LTKKRGDYGSKYPYIQAFALFNSEKVTSGSDAMNSTTDDDEIKFSKHSESYCVCIIDIVNSTKVTAKMTNSDDVRNYYSTFINSGATVARNFGARVIKNAGDSLIYYFPSTVDSSNECAFKNVLDCCVNMNAASSVISAKLYDEGLPPMLYRISADYGKVEIARTKTSQEHDFFGSTINLCAKINKVSVPDKILIGGDLFRVLKALPSISNAYIFSPAGEYSVGMKYAYPLYTVISKYDKPIIRSFNQIPQLKPIEKGSGNSENENIQNATRTAGRVLLVDDDKDILFTFRKLLTSEGILVISYNEPLEALKHFSVESHSYDLVVLDIRMPKINGIELYYRLKEINRDIKVLFLTALDTPEELVEALPGIQADNIIKKPVAASYFVTAIKKRLPCFPPTDKRS
jgi:two-component system response regulator ChvI